MVWYGIWYGVVWYLCGMVWYDMVWCGMVCYGMEQGILHTEEEVGLFSGDYICGRFK